MAIEVHMTTVNFGVQPTEDGGKQLNILDMDSGTIYRIPFVEAAATEIAERFGMSNEDLEKKVKAEQGAAKIEVARSMPPGLNGSQN